MKYQYLDESEVMQRLVIAILKQAVRDLYSRSEREKHDSEEFIKSEYCELLCGVIGKEYSILLRVAIRSYRKANSNE